MKRKGDRPLMKAISQIMNKDDLPWETAPKKHRHVLLVLLSYANLDTGECYPGLKRLAKDSEIPFTADELEDMIGDFQQFTGRAEKQTEEYLTVFVQPRLKPYKDILGKVDAELSV